LGVISKVLTNASLEIKTELVKDVDYTFFFRTLQNKELAQGMEEIVWASISQLSKIPSEGHKIIKILKFSNLQEQNKIRCILHLIDEHEMNEDIVVLLRDLAKSAEPKVISMVMDVIAYCIQKNTAYTPNIIEIGKTILYRAADYTENKRISDWLPWLKMHINGLTRPTDKFVMNPETAVIVDISHDGLQCKPQVRRGFASCLSNKSVKQGKWYYEALMLTQGLFQIGWTTDEYKPDPEGGGGVGDDTFSWAIDLHRKQKMAQRKKMMRMLQNPMEWVQNGPQMVLFNVILI